MSVHPKRSRYTIAILTLALPIDTRHLGRFLPPKGAYPAAKFPTEARAKLLFASPDPLDQRVIQNLCRARRWALGAGHRRRRVWLTDGDFSGLGPSGGWIIAGINRKEVPARPVPCPAGDSLPKSEGRRSCHV
jgi:hypothetical protein